MSTVVSSFGFKSQFSNGIKGFLIKRGHVMKNWKHRFFVLSGCELKYYTDESCQQLQGGYLIKSDSLLNCGEFEGKKLSISLEAERLDTKKLETLHISANTNEERDNWFNALDETIHSGFHVINQPDVWSSFYPSLELTIKYSKTIQVNDGNEILPSETKIAPDVNFSVLRDTPTEVYYTLVMLNVDHAVQGNLLVPRRKYIQWAVLNIQYNEISKANHVLKYQGPAPFKGSNYNRYFFLLFRQGSLFSLDQIASASVDKRDNFSLSQWALNLNLGDPIAINGFYSAYESGYCENWLHTSYGMISPALATTTPPDLPSNGSTNGTVPNPPKSSPAVRRPSVDEADVDRMVELMNQGKISLSSPPVQRRGSKDENVVDAQVVLLAKMSNVPLRTSSKDAAEDLLNSQIESMIKSELPSALKKYSRVPGTPKKCVTFLIHNPALMSDPQPVTSSFYEDGEVELPRSSSFEDSVSDYQISLDGSSNSYNSPIRTSSSNADSTSNASDLSIMTVSLPSPSESSTDNSSPTPTSSTLQQLLPPSPLSRRSSSAGSMDSNSPGVVSNRTLVPLMQRVAAVNDTEGYCNVFGVTTQSIFDGTLMRKKFSKDLMMKESYVWIDPTSKSIHWAKSATEKNVTHKHILLDKNSSYAVVGGADSEQLTPNYTKKAGGTQMGIIKGAELEDLTITIATEDDNRLKIKIPPEHNNSSLRAKEWFKVIKLLTQDTSR